MPLENDEGEDLQLTGSTFSGNPSVVGGVYYGSGNVGSLPAYVQSLRVDPSGSVFVTASGSLPVHIDAPVSIGGEVSIANFPAVQAISGNVGTYTSGLQGVSGTVQVWSEGALPVSGTVTAEIGNWPATIGVSSSSPLQVYSSGTLGVSGSVALTNWPATLGVSASATLPVALVNWPAVHGVSSSSPSGFWSTGGELVSGSVNTYTSGPQAVTGSQLTGSTFVGYPVVVAGTDGVYVRSLLTDAAGALYITTSPSGTLLMTVQGLVPSGTTQAGNPVEVSGVDTTGIVRSLQTDAQGRLVVAPAGTNVSNGIAFGDISLAATSIAFISETTYTEQTGSAVVRALVSSNTNDTAAGTGARTVQITYYDQNFNGPFTETVTLNGTTRVPTVSTTMCFIEKMTVMTVGSGGSNAGTLSLLIGNYATAPTLWTITVGENQTFAAHHYVSNSKSAFISGITVNNNSTTAGNGALYVLKGLSSGSNQVEAQVSDFVRLYGQANTVVRNYGTPIKFSGPGRLRLYVTPEATSAQIYRGGFDFYDQ